MKTIKTILIILALSSTYSWSQLTQTVRGTIVDFDTKIPIIGAKVIIVDTDPIKGSVSDINGDFRLEEVPVGRINLKITSVGYQEIYLPNALVESGKEKVLQLQMIEDIKTLSKVEVSAQKDKSESINKMATTSAKTFTVEETSRYAGSFNDPARMASGFAGVTGNPEGDNDIVVRGNSPRGILWRLEGIDIPNPNHFANTGGTGGPISALNGSMLANSDFFSGAFAPEYGNALSGVFDVNFRYGNNEKREYNFSIGALGVDGTLEGPFKKGYRGSYLVNYRYSSIGLLDKLGILDFGGIPIYQDAAFKVHLPTKKAGTFSLIGMGGISHILESYAPYEDTIWTYDFGANLGVVGLKHTYIFNEKAYLKSYVAASTSSNFGEGRYIRTDSSSLFDAEKDLYRDNQLKGQTIFNYKLNKKNLFQVGATYTRFNYRYFYEDDYDNQDGIMKRWLDADGSADMIQSFVSWKYRINQDLTMVSGVHHTQFFLNNSYAVEPRVGLKYNMHPRHSISLGAGMHSRIESISTYLYNEIQSDGSYKTLNKNLGLSKSVHTVAGYNFQLSDNMYIKTELYYQHLYNLPVANDSSSYFSLVNSSAGIPDVELVNKGTGRNYGVELTLERFFNNGYYYLLTGSLYKSEYKALDGITRSTRFDAGYAANLLFGKEWSFGKKQNKAFAINSKVSLIGGNRYTPVDLEASKDAGYTIFQTDKGFSAKGDNVFIWNLGLTYRCDMKRATHSFKIDVQNLTNNQARIREWYSNTTQSLEYDTQLSIIPNVVYSIKF
ncbi:TonB-dependent receptor [Paracrocinitomix mangrovi]|uniref:TonB-dependent receptor n=1 Tax=Paracrocinitomix mangrovi TaxID=2862509 RepID=UPI001C8F09C4|nr:TonB-dependent receptor [Paracrocinitomix mangrovi]UKN01082.1 TonB-dependent receptor [Paracrocinitomix mangrovi]